MTSAEQVAGAQTFLFVPGDRPERFAKAMAAGADVVIIDLEDAVAAGQHQTALDAVVEALTGSEIRALVRVHPTGDSLHARELDVLMGGPTSDNAGVPLTGLLGLVVAKADDPAALRELRDRVSPELAVIPLIESAQGMVLSLEIAQIPGVTRLAFGAVDYTLDIGARPEPEFLASARSQLVLVSRVASIAAPLDSPPTEILDLEVVAAGAARARGYGFGGALAIHPAQLSALRTGFAPTSAEVEWAREVLAAEDRDGAGAGQVRGQLVDRPVFDRARAIIRKSEGSR